MAEIRYNDRYENGVLVEQIPYTVSDEELALEAIETEIGPQNDQALANFQNWDTLTPPERMAIVKFLLGEYIQAHRYRYTPGE